MSSTNPATIAKVATYNAAVDAASADPTDANMATVSSAYAALPAGSRGGAMASALASADPANLAALLAAHNNLPTPSSRVERRIVTDQEADAVRDILSHGIMIAGKFVLDGFYGDDVDPFVFDMFADAGDDVIDFIANKLRVGGGRRTTHNVDPTDVVPADSDIVCNYKGGNIVGTLNADNTVTVGDDTFASLSKAAIAVTGQQTANGWVHWTYNGTKLAALRDAS